MNSIHSIIIPGIIVLFPLFLFAIHLFIRGSLNLRRIVLGGLLYFIFGMVVPWLACFYIQKKGLENVWIPARGGGGSIYAEFEAEQAVYQSKAMFFFYFGYLVNLIGFPLSGWIWFLRGKKNQKLVQ